MTTTAHSATSIRKLKRTFRLLYRIRDYEEQTYRGKRNKSHRPVLRRLDLRLRNRLDEWRDAWGSIPVHPCPYCEGTGQVFHAVSGGGGHYVPCNSANCENGWRWGLEGR